MGYYRFILAICVALSHYQFFIYGYNPGVAAVVSFMLLSGYVMTLLITRHYASIRRIPLFYFDRLCRLLPQFLFYSLLVLVLARFSAVGQVINYQNCSRNILLLNFTLIGNNFYQKFGQCMLIPASWSIGLESFFYLAIPWLILTRLFLARQAFVMASLGVFIAAILGYLNFDLYAFRYLTGTLYIFLVGGSIARPDIFGRWLPHIVWCLIAAIMAYALYHPSLYSVFQVKEVLLGILVGIPVLLLIHTIPFSEIDEFLGNISYGVFLNHVAIQWIFRAYFGIHVWSLPAFSGAMLLCITLSAVTYCLIERPALQLRRRIRNN